MMGAKDRYRSTCRNRKNRRFCSGAGFASLSGSSMKQPPFFWLKDGTNDFLKDSITNLMPFVNPMRKKYFYEWKNDMAEQGLSEFFVKTVAFPIKLCYNCIHRRQVFLPHFIFTVHFMQKCHGIQQEAYNYENTRIR